MRTTGEAALKLSQVLEARDIAIETSVRNELEKILPHEYAKNTKDLFVAAIRSARAHFDNRTLDELYGDRTAGKIRARLRNITIEPANEPELVAGE